MGYGYFSSSVSDSRPTASGLFQALLGEVLQEGEVRGMRPLHDSLGGGRIYGKGTEPAFEGNPSATVTGASQAGAR